MYKRFIRPLLFSISTEQAYNLMLTLLRIAGHIPGMKYLLRARYNVKNESLQRDVFGLNFKNPIGLAPGIDVNGEVIDGFEALGFGFVEIGAITPVPQVGNPKSRLFKLPADNAIVNRMGNPNKGLNHVVKRLRGRKKGDIIVGCNIARNIYTQATDVPKEFLMSFRKLYQYVDYFTINVISTNSATDSIVFDKELLHRIVDPLFEFRRGQSEYRPILLKLSADLSDEQIDMTTDLMIETPLDGIVAIAGTLQRCDELKSDHTSIVRIGSGRLSGEPIRERAIEVVKRVHQRCNGTYPIIGVGGVMSADDAHAMLDAGASLVQIHSGLLYEGAGVVKEICSSLNR